jgi:hypothetical protein
MALHSLFIRSLSLGGFFLAAYFSGLSATRIPFSRSEVDSTSRMNTGGDEAEHPGLRGNQLGSYPIDSISGKLDYYYSNYGSRNFEGTRNDWDVYMERRGPYFPSYGWNYPGYAAPGYYPDSATYDQQYYDQFNEYPQNW